MPTSLNYFSNKYRCHEQFAQHKSSCARLTCSQSIYICHVIVLNTLSVFANLFSEVYISHWPLWLDLIEWNHLVWQFVIIKNQTNKQKTCSHTHNKTHLYRSKQTNHINTKSHWGWEFSKVVRILMSVTSWGEWSGMVSTKKKKKNPLQMSFIVHWYEMSPRTTKGNLAKVRRKKNLCLFLKSASLLNVNTSMSQKLSSKPDTTAKAVAAYKH